MKKLTILLLLIGAVCFGQNYKFQFAGNAYVQGILKAKDSIQSPLFKQGKDTLGTKDYVRKTVAAATSGLLDLRGNWDASTGVFPSTGGSGVGGAIMKGDYWVISVAGTISGITLPYGDNLLALVDNPGQTAANWNHVPIPQTINLVAAPSSTKGAIEYYGTSLKDGAFFGSDLTPTSANIGGFNGYFKATKFSGSGTNLLIGSATSSTNDINFGYGAGQASVTIGSNFWIHPNAGSGTTAYKFGTKNNLSSGLIVDIQNFGTTQASFDYIGKLTCNGANFGINSGSTSNVTTTNSSVGVGYDCLNSDYGVGYRVQNTSYGIGIYSQNSGSGDAVKIQNNTQNGIGLRISQYLTGVPFEIDSVSTKKMIIDYQGDIHNNPPHAASYFFDSSRVVALTQNNWVGITNAWKNLFPAGDFTKITKTGDSIKIQKNGHYLLTYEVNASGTSSATYEYRVRKRSGATITTIGQYRTIGAGSVVVRMIHGYLEGNTNDVFWVEVRTTSAGSNDITVLGGNMIVTTIHLNL